MAKEFVRVLCDVHCDWEGLPPIYRVFVNDELFTERTYIWHDVYLAEMLQIQAPPGQYKIRVKSAGPVKTKFKVRNRRIEAGPGIWVDDETLEISHAST
jgi:hypothetical protein